ncbi:mucin-19 isoform X3 [Macrotis lagotis]|uniref:mucin-19 isoform X3 n=1 Tax=Macrotis lagotis TaxID=92651 RepID=UPI003D69404A
MQIQIDPVMQLYISLSPNKFTNTVGLCGSYNNKAEDDFLSSQKMLEKTSQIFADSWEMMPCPKGRPSSCISIENEMFAEKNCLILTDPSGVFSSCHSVVDPRSYHEKCKTYTCTCENIQDCLCTTLGNYVKACAENGVYINGWRKGRCVEQTCQNGLVFKYNVRACNSSCQSLSKRDKSCDVQDVPVDGCACPDGMYLNSEGSCVLKSQCDCYISDEIVKPGTIASIDGNVCMCQDGTLLCPDSVHRISQNCTGGAEYVNCSEPNAQQRQDRTCRSRNIPSFNEDISCRRGCFCPIGMVRDSKGNCIFPDDCPCYFGGWEYDQGSTTTVGCNECTCIKGSWSCTQNKCQTSCHIYGDGHVKTFDGKSYSFDGLCQYSFVEDYCGQEYGTFRVLTESVPCCEDGLTCSRKIIVALKDQNVVLHDGKVTVLKTLDSKECELNTSVFSMHTVGLYLILKFVNGLILIWDKNTRVSAILDPSWSRKVCGLCGNNNGDLKDDFTTRHASVAVGALEFGNSWKTSQECSDTVVQTFPCDSNPYCKAWALRKCGIIRDSTFKDCHSKVDPDAYYTACLEEACACDMEGKYLGFCTAVAMYAEACSAVGVCISWRKPDLCPVYCDFYNAPGECSWHYEPCGTVKAKTCKDHLIGQKFATLLEGCYAKCPDSAPYLDENTMKCVSLSECSCFYNDVIPAGGIIENECGRTCSCIAGQLQCSDAVTSIGGNGTNRAEITPTVRSTSESSSFKTVNQEATLAPGSSGTNRAVSTTKGRSSQGTSSSRGVNEGTKGSASVTNENSRNPDQVATLAPGSNGTNRAVSTTIRGSSPGTSSSSRFNEGTRGSSSVTTDNSKHPNQEATPAPGTTGTNRAVSTTKGRSSPGTSSSSGVNEEATWAPGSSRTNRAVSTTIGGSSPGTSSPSGVNEGTKVSSSVTIDNSRNPDQGKTRSTLVTNDNIKNPEEEAILIPGIIGINTPVTITMGKLSPGSTSSSGVTDGTKGSSSVTIENSRNPHQEATLALGSSQTNRPVSTKIGGSSPGTSNPSGVNEVSTLTPGSSQTIRTVSTTIGASSPGTNISVGVSEGTRGSSSITSDNYRNPDQEATRAPGSSRTNAAVSTTIGGSSTGTNSPSGVSEVSTLTPGSSQTIRTVSTTIGASSPGTTTSIGVSEGTRGSSSITSDNYRNPDQEATRAPGSSRTNAAVSTTIRGSSTGTNSPSGVSEGTKGSSSLTIENSRNPGQVSTLTPGISRTMRTVSTTIGGSSPGSSTSIGINEEATLAPGSSPTNAAVSTTIGGSPTGTSSPSGVSEVSTLTPGISRTMRTVSTTIGGSSPGSSTSIGINEEATLAPGSSPTNAAVSTTIGGSPTGTSSPSGVSEGTKGSSSVTIENSRNPGQVSTLTAGSSRTISTVSTTIGGSSPGTSTSIGVNEGTRGSSSVTIDNSRNPDQVSTLTAGSSRTIRTVSTTIGGSTPGTSTSIGVNEGTRGSSSVTIDNSRNPDQEATLAPGSSRTNRAVSTTIGGSSPGTTSPSGVNEEATLAPGSSRTNRAVSTTIGGSSPGTSSPSGVNEGTKGSSSVTIENSRNPGQVSTLTAGSSRTISTVSTTIGGSSPGTSTSIGVNEGTRGSSSVTIDNSRNPDQEATLAPGSSRTNRAVSTTIGGSSPGTTSPSGVNEEATLAPGSSRTNRAVSTTIGGSSPGTSSPSGVNEGTKASSSVTIENSRNPGQVSTLTAGSSRTIRTVSTTIGGSSPGTSTSIGVNEGTRGSSSVTIDNSRNPDQVSTLTAGSSRTIRTVSTTIGGSSPGTSTSIGVNEGTRGSSSVTIDNSRNPDQEATLAPGSSRTNRAVSTTIGGSSPGTTSPSGVNEEATLAPGSSRTNRAVSTTIGGSSPGTSSPSGVNEGTKGSSSVTIENSRNPGQVSTLTAGSSRTISTVSTTIRGSSPGTSTSIGVNEGTRGSSSVTIDNSRNPDQEATLAPGSSRTNRAVSTTIGGSSPGTTSPSGVNEEATLAPGSSRTNRAVSTTIGVSSPGTSSPSGVNEGTKESSSVTIENSRNPGQVSTLTAGSSRTIRTVSTTIRGSSTGTSTFLGVNEGTRGSSSATIDNSRNPDQEATLAPGSSRTNRAVSTTIGGSSPGTTSPSGVNEEATLAPGSSRTNRAVSTTIGVSSPGTSSPSGVNEGTTGSSSVTIENSRNPGQVSTLTAGSSRTIRTVSTTIGGSSPGTSTSIGVNEGTRESSSVTIDNSRNPDQEATMAPESSGTNRVVSTTNGRSSPGTSSPSGVNEEALLIPGISGTNRPVTITMGKLSPGSSSSGGVTDEATLAPGSSGAQKAAPTTKGRSFPESSSSIGISEEATQPPRSSGTERAITTTKGSSSPRSSSPSGVTERCLGPEPVCHGPLGEEKSPGDTWIINCHQCTCSDARSVDCQPKTCPSLPTCTNGEKLIRYKSNESCCETAYCEPRKCFYNNIDYKIGASFDDLHNPCVSYFCTQNGFVTVVQDCPKQSWCSEESRIYDSKKCCYTCKKDCKPIPVNVTVEYKGCMKKIEMAKCSGECKKLLTYNYETFQVENSCMCCQEDMYENREITLSCPQKKILPYTYRHIISCSCKNLCEKL